MNLKPVRKQHKSQKPPAIPLIKKVFVTQTGELPKALGFAYRSEQG